MKNTKKNHIKYKETTKTKAESTTWSLKLLHSQNQTFGGKKGERKERVSQEKKERRSLKVEKQWRIPTIFTPIPGKDKEKINIKNIY